MDFQSRRYINIIKYWLKVKTSDDNKLIKSVYNIISNDSETHPYKENWASSVKSLLSRLGFFGVW